MSKVKGASSNKKATQIEEVINTYDKITFGPSAYGDLSEKEIFHHNLKEQYENGSIPIFEVEKVTSSMTLEEMKEELKWCLNTVIRSKGDHLLAEIIYLLKKEFVQGPGQSVETAAIRMRKGNSDKYEMTLICNVDFFFGECVNREQRIAILYHEVYHVLFKHLTLRMADHQTVLWNIAQDLAINSLICNYTKNSDSWEADITMFPGACSGEVTLNIEDPRLNREDVERSVREYFSNLIENNEIVISEEDIQKEINSRMKMKRRVPFRSGCFPLTGSFREVPPNLSSEEYYEILKDPNGPVKWADIELMISKVISEHDWFSDVEISDLGEIPEGATEEFRNFYEAVKSRVRDHLSKRRRGLGTSSIDSILEKLYVPKPNWASILAKHISSSRKNINQTWIRMNRRGLKGVPSIQHDYVHNVRIYIDQSGSMSDKDISKMYNRIQPLLKSTEITVYHFDWLVDNDSKHKVKYAKDLNPIRTKCGGTNFNSVFEHFSNDKERVDVIIIMTDMGAPPPPSSDRRVVFMYSEDMSVSSEIYIGQFKKFKHKVIKLPA